MQAGMTYSIGKPKLWNTSFFATWEINLNRSGDVKPGPMLTGEYSFGRRFDNYQPGASRTALTRVDSQHLILEQIWREIDHLEEEGFTVVRKEGILLEE
jgi:hypothetical protein